MFESARLPEALDEKTRFSGALRASKKVVASSFAPVASAISPNCSSCPETM